MPHFVEIGEIEVKALIVSYEMTAINIILVTLKLKCVELNFCFASLFIPEVLLIN